MSKEDIEKAVHEAEQFAEEDKKRREDVDLRNGADQMVYQCEKMLSEEGDKFSDDEKNELNQRIDALKEALKGEDINLIKSKQDELQAKFYEISERLYKEAQAAQGAQDPNMGGAQGNPGDNFQEADFTDVD